MCSASGFSNLKVGCPHVRFTNCLHCIAVGLLRIENPVTPWLPGPQSQGPEQGIGGTWSNQSVQDTNSFGKTFIVFPMLLWLFSL